jgi:polysaccharide pyruvyl transferase WcaK-like protein
METGPLWGLTHENYHRVQDVILVGVGAKHYGNPTDFSQNVYHQALHPKLYHSIRDGYTEKLMRAMGFDNVINTGCPSLWQLTEDHLASIPHAKADHVVMTLTCYHRNPADAEMLRILKRNYNQIFFWPQGPEDIDYVKDMCNEIKAEITFLSPSLEAYDTFLSSNTNCDYVGTRLHGGIRALQHAKRTIIIGLDNRAIEMALDVGFPMVRRDNIGLLEQTLCSDFKTILKIPHENVQRWKDQFQL